MIAEDFGIELAKSTIGNADFQKAVEELGAEICDELVRAKVTQLRLKAEKEIGIQFVDEDKHFDFSMNFEGDVCRAFGKALAKYIQEY